MSWLQKLFTAAPPQMENILKDLPEYFFVNKENMTLNVREKILNKNGQIIILTAMSHVADEDFYSQVSQRAKDLNAFVLEEGVTDSGDPVISGTPKNPYGIVDFFGITHQKKDLFLGSDRVNADIDIEKDLNEDDKKILRKFVSHLQNFNMYKLNNSDPEVFNIILYKRNNHLLKVLKQHDNIPVIMIPWGAAHLKDIENRLIQQGFSVLGEKTYEIAPSQKIWTKILDQIKNPISR